MLSHGIHGEFVFENFCGICSQMRVLCFLLYLIRMDELGCVSDINISISRRNAANWGEDGVIVEKREMYRIVFEHFLGQFVGIGFVNFQQS